MKKIFKKSRFVRAITVLLPVMAMLACGHLGDRTTVVYGKVYDQNHQPVDSIKVLVSGLKLNGVYDLKSTYTDENGDYEIVLEVPRKFGNINVMIPYGMDNPKYEKMYRHAKLMNEQNIRMIGKKTEWNFQLEAK